MQPAIHQLVHSPESQTMRCLCPRVPGGTTEKLCSAVYPQSHAEIEITKNAVQMKFQSLPGRLTSDMTHVMFVVKQGSQFVNHGARQEII